MIERADGQTTPLDDLMTVVQRIVRLEAENERMREALRAIRGPEDAGPWIVVYRDAGGGYEGLQAIARAALREETA